MLPSGSSILQVAVHFWCCHWPAVRDRAPVKLRLKPARVPGGGAPASRAPRREVSWSGRKGDGGIETGHCDAKAHWIDLHNPVAIKSRIDHPRHQDDGRVLERVRDRSTAQE